jgi:hypothetical protein
VSEWRPDADRCVKSLHLGGAEGLLNDEWSNHLKITDSYKVAVA